MMCRFCSDRCALISFLPSPVFLALSRCMRLLPLLPARCDQLPFSLSVLAALAVRSRHAAFSLRPAGFPPASDDSGLQVSPA